jgi:hypothetical protein
MKMKAISITGAILVASVMGIAGQASAATTYNLCIDKVKKTVVVKTTKCSSNQVLVTGSKGATGSKGSTGAVGAAGPAGPAGVAGPAGAKGDAGVAGPAGAKGDTGAAGADGAPGSAVDKGDKGDTGAPGAKGDTGEVGPAGAAGPAGAKGDTGLGLTQDSVGQVCSVTKPDTTVVTGTLKWVEQATTGVYVMGCDTN